jgi:preprotein translocase subunit SecG
MRFKPGTRKMAIIHLITKLFIVVFFLILLSMAYITSEKRVKRRSSLPELAGKEFMPGMECK